VTVEMDKPLICYPREEDFKRARVGGFLAGEKISKANQSAAHLSPRTLKAESAVPTIGGVNKIRGIVQCCGAV